MSSATFHSNVLSSKGRGVTGAKHAHSLRKSSPKKNARNGDGFTLVELLITLTILPLVVGALSLGIIAVFSLNNQTTSRLSDTADAQVVASIYQKDIQAAGYVTTVNVSSPQCGAGTGLQLLSLESVPNQTTGDFQSVVSYVGVPENNGPNGAATYSLVRLDCTNGSTTPVSQTTLANDLPTPTGSQPLVPPVVYCSQGASPSICSGPGSGTTVQCSQCTQGYVPAQDVGTIDFSATEPATSYNFNLDASPAAGTSFNSGGVASTPAATCETTAGSTGPYAGSLCLIDFSGLNHNDLVVAETHGSCYNMSIAVEATDILHFCLSISSNTAGEGAVPTGIPADTNAGLGNTVYPGMPGEPALYMSQLLNESVTLTMSLSAFSLVNSATGQPVTGWSFTSADAETTNGGETLSWTSNNPITVINDMELGAPAPDGNACAEGLTGTGTTTVTCTGSGSESVPLTGAAMVLVSGTNLTSFTANMNNYEAVAFGMILP
jgi:prepilin-type N-terminal cleavage/methylation domain-containing protein